MITCCRVRFASATTGRHMGPFPIQHVAITGFEDLKPLISGKVFHATTDENYQAILKSGYVRPNTEDRQSPFGSTATGFFRRRGCVSVFDYREFGSAAWREHAFKCLPTMPLEREPVMVLLFVSSAHHASLIPWSLWKEEAAWSERVVPHVEAGFLGQIPLAAIELAMILSRQQNAA